MGGSPSKEEKYSNKVNKNENYNKPNEIITIKRTETYDEPKKEVIGNIYEEKKIEIKNPYPKFEPHLSAPVPEIKENKVFKTEHEKDDNLELTDYFDFNNNNSEDRNKYEKIKQNYYQILNEINNKNNINNFNLEDINKNIYSYFGLKKSIEKEFNGTKSALLFCSSLSDDEAAIVNQLEYDQILKDEKKYKGVILQLIKSNLEEMMNQHFK